MFKVIGLAMMSWVSISSSSAFAETIDQSAKCLADNIYYEARDDGRTGWNAVGHVTLNRWHSALAVRPKSTICDVVYAGSRHGHHHCQFSWTCHHKIKAKTEPEDAAKILALSYKLIRDNPKEPTKGATYFHEKRVHPRWSHDGTAIRTAAIGHHYFYRPKRETEVAMYVE